MHKKIKDEALHLSAMGMAMHPLKPRDKLPMLKAWQKKCTKDAEQIEQYWEANPCANLGIATGEISGIFVLDVDGPSGFASLKSLCDQYGPLPYTLEADTGSGGKHYYFLWPECGQIRNSAGKLGTGLDIRGNGGYVVAPPSIHPNGKPYEWSVFSNDRPVSAPQWLLDLLSAPEIMIQGRSRRAKTSASEWRDLVREIPEGERNNSIARIAGKLLQAGIDPIVTLTISLSLNQYSCSPPLDENEVHQIVESICKKEYERLGGRA